MRLAAPYASWDELDPVGRSLLMTAQIKFCGRVSPHGRHGWVCARTQVRCEGARALQVVEQYEEPDACHECGNDLGPYDGLCLDCLEGQDDPIALVQPIADGVYASALKGLAHGRRRHP